MCREGAWIELTVKVTSMARIQSRALGFKILTENFIAMAEIGRQKHPAVLDIWVQRDYIYLVNNNDYYYLYGGFNIDQAQPSERMY